MGAERERVDGFGQLEDGLLQAGEWYRWGPYVSERQWGTVREDYSADGNAWDYLPHDHARSRAYRWGEDGLAGFCDVEQRLCLGLALWNGRDPILKERRVRADRPAGQPRRGRQGVLVVPGRHPQPRVEPVALPLPAGGVPVPGPDRCQRAPEPVPAGVRAAGHRRVRRRPVLDHRGALRQGRPGRPADVDPGHQRRAGGRQHPRAAHRLVPQHLGLGCRRAQAEPVRRGGGVGHRSSTRSSAPWSWSAPPAPTVPSRSCCSATTRPTRPGCTAAHPVTPYPKDGINDHVVHGAPTVNPERAGTKCAFWYRLTVPAGADRRAAAAAAPGRPRRGARRSRSAPASTR